MKSADEKIKTLEILFDLLQKIKTNQLDVYHNSDLSKVVNDSDAKEILNEINFCIDKFQDILINKAKQIRQEQFLNSKTA